MKNFLLILMLFAGCTAMKADGISTDSPAELVQRSNYDLCLVEMDFPYKSNPSIKAEVQRRNLNCQVVWSGVLAQRAAQEAKSDAAMRETIGNGLINFGSTYNKPTYQPPTYVVPQVQPSTCVINGNVVNCF